MSPSTSRKFLFVLWLLTGLVLLCGVGLTVWNLPLLRTRSDIHGLLIEHHRHTTIGDLLDRRGATEAERAQLRGCYLDPEKTDLHKMPWALVNRPTPFLGGAPEPGDQDMGHFNRQQMRADHDVAMPKPPGVFRIFITGGSLAYSVGASTTTMTIDAILQRDLNRDHGGQGLRYEVWSTAIPSWASAHERVMVENRLTALSPDLIIMLTGTNDCHWGWEGLGAMDVRTYTDSEFFALVNAGMKLDGLAPYPAEPPYAQAGPIAPAEVARTFATNVRLAAAAVGPQRVPVLVALQPYLAPGAKKELTAVEQEWLEKDKNGAKMAYFQSCFAEMKAELAKLPSARRRLGDPLGSLRFVSFERIFADRTDPVFLDLYHPGDKGDILLAEGLEKVLQDDGLLTAPAEAGAPAN